MSKKRDVCECLKQSAKAKKPRYVTLAGKIKQTPAAKFTYFLCAWRANLSQPQDQRLKYINHVARKQITVYYTHGLENKNYRSSFLTWGRERKWEKGIKYLKIAELLFLLLWRKKGQVTSFHLTLPILPSTQYSETQRSFQQFPAESNTSSVESNFEIFQKPFYGILLNLSPPFC